MTVALYDGVTVRYSSGEVHVGTPAAENSRWAFLEEASLTTPQQAQVYGEQWLSVHGVLIDQVTVGITGTRAAVTPYSGITKGDAVRLPDRTGTVETARIHSTGFTGLRRNGQPDWVITIGGAGQERAVAVDRQLAKIGGSMRSSFAASAPSVAPSFLDVSMSALQAVSLPIADTTEFSTEAPYDRTAPYRFPDTTAIVRFQCQAESLVGSTATQFELWRITYASGVPTETMLQRFTWPGGARLYQVLCEHTFSADQAYQLRIHVAGAHKLASIQPIGGPPN